VGLPAAGAPVYGKLDAELAAADVDQRGQGRGDRRRLRPPPCRARRTPTSAARPEADRIPLQPRRGVLGGISTGQPLVARIALKPTSSILTPLRSIDHAGRRSTSAPPGRHDPCVGLRAPPIAEAMVACVLADAFLRHRGRSRLAAALLRPSEARTSQAAPAASSGGLKCGAGSLPMPREGTCWRD
jgi:chorismate synthase